MRFAWIIFLSLSLAGCVTSIVYNPTPPTIPPEVAFNESGFKAVRDGMTRTQVHQIMGTKLVIGYQLISANYLPLTVPNPYKAEAIKDKGFLIEYYLEAIRRPDGVVNDDELMPLIFKNGKLIGRGWPLANSVHSN